MASEINAYNQWHESVHGKEDPSIIKLEEWHKNVLQFLPSVRDLRVLEVGCGVGDFALYLSQQGAEVTAVDFSSQAIKLATEKARIQNRKVDFRVADAQALPLENDSFDLIVSCECLEHIPTPQLALNEMYRVLKSSGKLILTTENYSNAMLLYWLVCWLRKEPFNSGEKVQPIEHLFLFWGVKGMFKKAGLKVRRLLGSHHVFLLLPRCHPHTFVIERFKYSLVAYLLRPFARHMTFEATKP
ncbi:MAG TPA: class I SAM-dependent methyltransferase [Cyanophyceae cyanobacterium]